MPGEAKVPRCVVFAGVRPVGHVVLHFGQVAVEDG